MDTTFDGILGHRVQIEQPKDGYRVAVDTVLLAASIAPGVGRKALDMGCGVGGGMLALAARLHDIQVIGIDLQPALVELCQKNIILNKMSDRLKAEEGDVRHFAGRGYDQVMMNPPYHDKTRHDVSPDFSKRVANTEKNGDLPIWIGRAAEALKPTGTLTLIHRADRLDEILGYMQDLFGAVQILSLRAYENVAPKRVIIRATKGGVFHVTGQDDFILHQPGGGYSDAAEAVLRHAEGLKWT